MTSSIQPLLTPQGQTLLEQWTRNPSLHLASPLHQSAALRDMGASADMASAILTQHDLRKRAVGKFGSLAEHMIFTRDGYEQATRLVVAQRHAQRFQNAGAQRIADLGCGNGADSTALLRAGLSVLSVDIDEDAAACTRWNLQVCTQFGALLLPIPTYEVRVADVTVLDIPSLVSEDVDGIFADPARRSGSARGGARVMSPQHWSPPLSTVLAWQDYVQFLGVKVAPGIEHACVPSEFCAEWVSVDGDLVEAALWSPALAPEGSGRQAVVIRGEETHLLRSSVASLADSPVEFAPVGGVGAFVAEPDPAVIRAGLVAELASRWGAHTLSEGMAYLSGDVLPDSPFAQRFEVIDVVGLKPKTIASALRQLNAHSVEVKKRGVDISPDALRQSIRKALVPKSPDSEEVTVIATRVGGRHCVILARRI